MLCILFGGGGRQQHNDAEGQAIRRGCHCECWPVYLCIYVPTMCVRVPLIGNGGVEFVPLQTISNVVIRPSPDEPCVTHKVHSSLI